MDKFTVEQIRVGMGLNQTEMGELLEMSRQKYALKESGKTKWYADEIDILMKLSGKRYDQISR